MSDSLLRHAEQLLAIRAELNSLDRATKVPRLQQFARLHLPQPDRVVGGAGCEEVRGRINIDGPNGALMAVIRP